MKSNDEKITTFSEILITWDPPTPKTDCALSPWAEDELNALEDLCQMDPPD